MAKKSMIERERKRQRMVEKYSAKLEDLKAQLANPNLSQGEKLAVHRQIQQIPRNANPTRLNKRCWLTGRPRGYYNDFGLCRNMLRDMAHRGLLPGVHKSSW
jgi:small subunit ribosomal protein S14